MDYPQNSHFFAMSYQISLIFNRLCVWSLYLPLFRYLFPLYTQCGFDTQAACTSIGEKKNPASKSWCLLFCKMFSNFFNNYYQKKKKIQLVRDGITFFKMFSHYTYSTAPPLYIHRHRLSSSLSEHVRLTRVFSHAYVRSWTLYVVPTASLVPKPFGGR